MGQGRHRNFDNSAELFVRDQFARMARVVRTQLGVIGCLVLSKVENATNEGTHRTGVGVNEKAGRFLLLPRDYDYLVCCWEPFQSSKEVRVICQVVIDACDDVSKMMMSLQRSATSIAACGSRGFSNFTP